MEYNRCAAGYVTRRRDVAFFKTIWKEIFMKRIVAVAALSLFASSGISGQRLPDNVVPDSYDLRI